MITVKVFTLIIMMATNPARVGAGITVTNIPGFLTMADCTKAGIEAQIELQKDDNILRFVCVSNGKIE